MQSSPQSNQLVLGVVGAGAMGRAIAQIAAHQVSGDPRCRSSPWLARRAQLGLAQLHVAN